jgi:hypothetical protein
MRRFVTILAATAASTGVAVAVTLPAVAGESAHAGLADCLRTEGLDVPGDVDSAAELEQWWRDARPRQPAVVDDAVVTCKVGAVEDKREVEKGVDGSGGGGPRGKPPVRPEGCVQLPEGRRGRGVREVLGGEPVPVAARAQLS